MQSLLVLLGLLRWPCQTLHVNNWTAKHGPSFVCIYTPELAYVACKKWTCDLVEEKAVKTDCNVNSCSFVPVTRISMYSVGHYKLEYGAPAEGITKLCYQPAMAEVCVQE